MIKDYIPELHDSIDMEYFKACNNLHRERDSIEIFLNNMFTRLVANTFIPQNIKEGGVKKEITLETARALSDFIKEIPIFIRKGNEMFLNRTAKK